jgi:hypothetical protein
MKKTVALKKMNMKNGELAEFLGVKPSTLSTYSTLPPKHAKKISAHLGIETPVKKARKKESTPEHIQFEEISVRPGQTMLVITNNEETLANIIQHFMRG